MGDPAEALEALPDGMTVGYAMERLGIGRTAFYARLQALGIEPRKHKGRAWVSTEQLEQLRTYGMAAEAAKSPSKVAMALARGTSLALQHEAPSSSAADGVRERLELLKLRLAVIREAVEMGGPLTTEDVHLLLGARPGGPEVVRGRILAVREGRDCWTLEQLAEEV